MSIAKIKIKKYDLLLAEGLFDLEANNLIWYA